MEKRYATKGSLSLKQADSLVAKLIYSVEGISNCFLDMATQEVVVELTAGCDVPLLEKTLDLITGWEKDRRILSPRIYKASESKEQSNLDLHDIDTIYAHDGSVSRDFAVELFEMLDALFVKVPVRHNARLRKYPAMIPFKVMEKCKYISSFPQNIHFVSEIPHCLSELERVKETSRFDEIARLSEYALTPAVCLHCYEELTGMRLNEPLILTARGTCHRHEAPWRLGKHRLNEFSVRETVFIGKPEFIGTQRKLFMDEVWQLFESLGLEGKIETATDPFYFSEDAAKGQHQMMAYMKYELIVTLGSEAFSVCSFNDMSDSLCKPFDICDSGNNVLSSGCFGFGIDRWAYALLRKHGTDLSGWPAQARELLISANN